MTEYTGRGRESKGQRGVKKYPFRTAAAYYRSIGWSGTIPVTRWGTKAPLAKGVTGHNGVDLDDEELLTLIDVFPTANIGLRLPWNIIGIDVDAYDGRNGARSLMRLAMSLQCPLPTTWRSTSRAPEDDASGIYLFRAPRSTNRAWITDLGPDSGIEIAQFHHRFATVSPSIHNTTGREYRWWYGSDMVHPPHPDDLPVLPVPWGKRLMSPNDIKPMTAAYSQKVYLWFDNVARGNMCHFMKKELDAEVVKIRQAIAGSGLHDTLIASVMHICMNAAEGHCGLQHALNILEYEFMKADRRRNLRSEWGNAVSTAMAKAAALPQELVDVCSLSADRKNLDWRRTS